MAAKGAILFSSILGAFTLVSPEAAQAAEEQELNDVSDQLAEQYMKRERQKNMFVKYGTASHYTGDKGAAGWIGTIIDFVNPIADVIDITDLIEDVYDWLAGVNVDELMPNEPECPGCER